MKFRNPFKKPTESEKVLAEIESIEFKKSSIVSAMNSAEMEYERQKINCFAQLGEYVYSCHLEDNHNYNLDEFFQNIAEMEKILEEKKSKVKDLSDRYDEEISLLSVNLNILNTQTNAIMVDAKVVNKFCSDCGNNLSQNDAFCQSCGKKL